MTVITYLYCILISELLLRDGPVTVKNGHVHDGLTVMGISVILDRHGFYQCPKNWVIRYLQTFSKALLVLIKKVLFKTFNSGNKTVVTIIKHYHYQ